MTKSRKTENISPAFHVRMFGGFVIRYMDKELSIRKNVVTKAMHLLQILLYYYKEGISKEKLIEYLFQGGDLEDPSNNLRVAVFRMKKMLVNAGFPKEEYVRNEDGRYYWSSSIPVYNDVLLFSDIMEKADNEEEEKHKVALLEEALRVYQGDFLPKLSGEYWVLVETSKYRDMYTRALQSFVEYLRIQEDYEKMLEVSTAACKFYPLDEWQSVKIEALMGLNRNKEALKVYKETSKMLFEELSIKPSEKLLSKFQLLGERMMNVPHDMEEIKKRIKEEEHTFGAYYVSLPSFIDIYRLFRRMIERTGQSIYILLCTLTDGAGNPMETSEKLNIMCEKLSCSIEHSLRKGDSFTKYSSNQFLIMLPGVTEEQCTIVSDRITKNFAEQQSHRSHYVEFFASSIVDIDDNLFGISSDSPL